MRYFLIAILLAAFLAACVPASELSPGTTTAPVELEALPEEPVAVPEPVAETQPTETPTDVRFTVEGIEGELIQLKPQAIDPDGDKVYFTFTKPFDAEGNWQTKIGDEGKYNVAVGASDGKSTTTESVLVVVKRANRPPVIDCKDIVVNEGEVVDLHQGCVISDEDDTEVVVLYGGWMSGWKYQTTYDDAGKHYVTITASDKRKGEILHTVIRNTTITVNNVNRAPVFSDDFPTVISGIENDVITLPSNLISDPDKDKVTVTYSAPFDASGVWKTKIGDAGTYDVDVVASDGETTVKKTVTIKLGLLNTAPTLKRIPDITVKEGETVKIAVDATDREGDALTTSITGWMTSDTYRTTYEDAGQYTVKVTVTDGEFKTEQVVHITVTDVNRAPVFVTPA